MRKKVTVVGGGFVGSTTAQRIHDEHTDFPIDLIETHVICWLEMEFAPPTYTPEQWT